MFVRSSTGRFWRERISRTGPSTSSSTATRHASAVSAASEGRITVRFGIARSAAMCSTGWWVGPSSPSAIESCEKTHSVGRFMSADRRIAGRM